MPRLAESPVSDDQSDEEMVETKIKQDEDVENVKEVKKAKIPKDEQDEDMGDDNDDGNDDEDDGEPAYEIEKILAHKFQRGVWLRPICKEQR